MYYTIVFHQTSSSSSSSGTAYATLYHDHFGVVEVHPRTAAIISLDSVTLYVGFPTTSFSPAVFFARRHSRGVTLPPHSTPLHSAPLEPLTPLDYSSPPGSVFDSKSDSDFETVAASNTLFFTPSKSMPA